MNNQNRMEKLLEGVPVEWKAVRAVLVCTKGTKIIARKMQYTYYRELLLSFFNAEEVMK
jgi:hypothetical protein